MIDLNCILIDPQKMYLMLMKVPQDQIGIGIYSYANLDKLSAGLHEKGIQALILQIPDTMDVTFVEQLDITSLTEAVIKKIQSGVFIDDVTDAVSKCNDF